jgi:L-amino acid N-acyltransferase YncA
LPDRDPDLPISVDLRPATPADAGILLEWATEAGTRAASFHTDPISAATHARWLEAVLADPHRTLLIGVVDGRPVGQLRLDRHEVASRPAGVEAEVSISIAPAERGRGLGRALLLAGLEAGPDADAGRGGPPVRAWIARVRLDNRPSLALFRGAGFEPVRETTCDGVPCVELRRPA